VTYDVEVLEDFGDTGYKEERETIGILLKGDKFTITLENGQEQRFGNGYLNDVIIPHKEIDELQFTIYNRDGKCYLVD
jgi:hypothetical protein